MKWARLWPATNAVTASRQTQTTHADDAMIAFQVIGELRENPRHLLMHGDDGTYYGYDLDTGEINAIDLDTNWAVDLNCPSQMLITSRSSHNG
jgi:hypothetical protein